VVGVAVVVAGTAMSVQGQQLASETLAASVEGVSRAARSPQHPHEPSSIRASPSGSTQRTNDAPSPLEPRMVSASVARRSRRARPTQASYQRASSLAGIIDGGQR